MVTSIPLASNFFFSSPIRLVLFWSIAKKFSYLVVVMMFSETPTSTDSLVLPLFFCSAFLVELTSPYPSTNTVLFSPKWFITYVACWLQIEVKLVQAFHLIRWSKKLPSTSVLLALRSRTVFHVGNLSYRAGFIVFLINLLSNRVMEYGDRSYFKSLKDVFICLLLINVL